MELSSNSDSECELYTKAAENLERKMKQLQQEKEKFEMFVNLVPEEDFDQVTRGRSSVDKFMSTKPPVEKEALLADSDSDDSIPLAEMARKLRSRNRPSNKRKVSCVRNSKKRKKQSCYGNEAALNETTDKESNSSQTVIVLDDDTGFQTSFAPIDFNSRSKMKANNSLNETSCSLTLNSDSEGDDSFDSETPVTLSIAWDNGKQCSRKEFKVRRYQKLETVYEELAKIEGIPQSRIVLLRNFNPIKPTDTPSSLNLKFYGALTGAISKTDLQLNTILTSKNEETVLAEGELVVKLQLETKQILTVTIRKNQKMIVLYEKCSEELKCPINKLKINFDGELVSPNERPSDLDLEGGEMFHVHLKN